MNTDDYIYVAENKLDKDFCKHCIQKFNKDQNRYQGVVGDGVNLEVKQSIDLTISDYDNWVEEDNIFYKSFKDTLESYQEWLSHPFPDDCFRGRIEDTGYQIQETKPGEFYTWHQDGMDCRMLTIIWYLNDIDEDGYTEFYTGLKIQPKMGKILMFPALWPWIHRGYPPKYETKYICTGWIRNISEGEVINRGEQSE